MREVYEFILKNLIENKGILKTYISFTRVKGKDLALIPGKIIYINKKELILFLMEEGFDIESFIIDNMETFYLSISKDQLIEQEKKYQK